MIGVGFLAVFAFSAVMAAGAQATTAPYWTIGGTRLVAGKTHNLAARIKTSFVLATPAVGVTISCTKLAITNGVLLGSSGNEPGTDNEITDFTGCTVTGNGSPCEVENSSITTNPLKSELVFDSTGKKLETLFEPSKGVTFVTVKFLGSGCTSKSTAVTGQVVAENTTDTSSEGNIELGQTPTQATSFNLRFPEVTIKEITRIKNGVAEKVEVEQQEAFTNPSVQTGVSLTLLANTKFEAEYSSWSALP